MPPPRSAQRRGIPRTPETEGAVRPVSGESCAGEKLLRDLPRTGEPRRQAAEGNRQSPLRSAEGTRQDAAPRATPLFTLTTCSDGTLLVTYQTGAVESYAPLEATITDGVLLRHRGRFYRRTAVVVAAEPAPAAAPTAGPKASSPAAQPTLALEDP